jgi:hypothetical protein
MSSNASLLRKADRLLLLVVELGRETAICPDWPMRRGGSSKAKLEEHQQQISSALS